ncbi:MAG TPA: polysaccharide deacetylase family protein [Polyangiaceae bacterium]|jgi:peptidoglycan/xylan/chitin deacetylase (PgdA/CDA1 family)
MPPGRVVLYAATLGVLVMVGRAVLVGPVPFLWSAIVTAVYASLVFGGVFILRWRVFADAVVRGPRGARGVALTFDDGPHPKWTPRILATLAKHGAKATFFVVARKAEEHPEVVKAILDAGHAVGLHSYAHDRFFALRRERRVRDDLVRGIDVLERLTGERPVIFRPPIGHTNPIIARVADDLDLTVVGWTVSGHDGVASAHVDDVIARVRRDLEDRAIIALHDAPEKGDREPAAVKALPAILDAIAAERLEVVPLTPWVSAVEGT